MKSAIKDYLKPPYTRDEVLRAFYLSGEVVTDIMVMRGGEYFVPSRFSYLELPVALGLCEVYRSNDTIRVSDEDFLRMLRNGKKYV